MGTLTFLHQNKQGKTPVFNMAINVIKTRKLNVGNE